MTRHAVTIAMLAFATGVGAQTLADPMRPPALAVDGPAARPAGAAVQMIVIAPEYRYAVIDGHTVAQGGRYGDAHVLHITETDVALRDPEGKVQVLKLLPQVQKKTTGTGEKGRR